MTGAADTRPVTTWRADYDCTGSCSSGAQARVTVQCRFRGNHAAPMCPGEGQLPTPSRRLRYRARNLPWQANKSGLVQANVLVVERRVVDADLGWGDPGRHLAGVGDALHQAGYKAVVFVGR